jgi:hypothetical protein
MTNHRDKTAQADRDGSSRRQPRGPGRETNGWVPPRGLTSELLGGDPNTVDETLGRGFGNPFRGTAQAGSGPPPSGGSDREHLSRIAPLAYQHRMPVLAESRIQLSRIRGARPPIITFCRGRYRCGALLRLRLAGRPHGCSGNQGPCMAGSPRGHPVASRLRTRTNGSHQTADPAGRRPHSDGGATAGLS